MIVCNLEVFDELCTWLDIPPYKDFVIPCTSESFDFLHFPLVGGEENDSLLNVKVAVIDSCRILSQEENDDDNAFRFSQAVDYRTVGVLCDECDGKHESGYRAAISGHGFFCSAIVGSIKIPGAMIRDLDLGCLRGLDAPPRLAIYGVGCPSCNKKVEEDMVRGINAAIKDKVGVISMSLSRVYPALLYSDDTDPSFHARDIAMLEAIKRDIVTVVPAGNLGQYGLQSAMKAAPWCLLVASCTSKKTFWTRLILDDGDEQKTIQVNCLNVRAAPEDGKWGTVRFHGDFSSDKPSHMYEDGSTFWVGDADEKKTIPPTGSTIIYIPAQYNETLSRMRTNADFIGRPLWAKIRSSHKKEIGGTPLVSDFSGRGPCFHYKEFMQPSLCAPGEEIAAAWPGDVPLSGDGEFDDNAGKSGNDDAFYANYNILNGTSFAVPHVAAAAAALRAQNNFSATAIMSALITSADGMHGKDKFREFAYGAGMINLRKALRPGLVYEESAENFEAWWYRKELPHFKLNLAYMSATFPPLKESWKCTFHRKVKSVESGRCSYTGRIEKRFTSLDVALTEIEMTISQAKVEFNDCGDEVTFSVDVYIPFTTAPVEVFGLVSASLIWQHDDIHDVQVVSPIILSSTKFPNLKT